MHHSNSFSGRAAALLLHEVPWHLNKMTDEEYLFPDSSLLCEGGHCAPPTFNIPPPPRPPWMEELEDCSDGGRENQRISEWLSEVHSCDNTLIRDSQTYFEDTFHSIAIIVVSAIILVIIFLAFGLYLFRRRKNFRDNCQNSPMPPLEGRQVTRFVGSVNPPIDCATPTHLSHTLGPLKPPRQVFEGQAVTSLTPSGLTMTRCLANHYIPEQKMMTLDFAARKQQIRERLGEPRNNIMELSERPPLGHPQAPQPSLELYQNQTDYPHIVIGGKPFFLVPSIDASESYAYPQQMPIYEEIDYGTVSTQPAQHSPAGGSHQTQSSHMVLDRPLSSTASHSNSAHTNTSELSSGDTSSASSQKMDELHHHHLHHTPNKQIKRLADQPLERSRSPQSAYSAKLANKQTNSSVYYYSDTLKKEDKVNTRVTIDKKNNAQGSTLV